MSFQKLQSLEGKYFPYPPKHTGPLDRIDRAKSFEQQRKELMFETNYDEFSHYLDRLRTQWACITAKSQRTKKNSGVNVSYVVEQYSQLTQIKPQYERINPGKPPNRENEVIQRFTERSRQRMMNKARKLNKNNLPIPYFVTLTYHKNYKDCRGAKDHLNAFFQRWRRRGADFAYFWKMEPQKRGAVHFHLAMFLPDSTPVYSPKKWNIKPDTRAEFDRHDCSPRRPRIKKLLDITKLRYLIGRDWAEVTKEIDGNLVPFTRFQYVRKTKKKPEQYSRAPIFYEPRPMIPRNYEYGKVIDRLNRARKSPVNVVSTYGANPELCYKYERDIEHELYGTNVRSCYSWKMFLGYCYSYMGEELEDHPFGRPRIKATILNNFRGYPRPPYKHDISPPEFEVKETGRFWGFSSNLDFAALQTGIVNNEDLERLNRFCNRINDAAYSEFLDHMKTKKKKVREKYGNRPRKLDREFRKIENTVKAQTRRYEVNKHKIKAGYMLQFEINSRKSGPLIRELQPPGLREYYNEYSLEPFRTVEDMYNDIFRTSLGPGSE